MAAHFDVVANLWSVYRTPNALAVAEASRFL